ncbi:P-loop NTPase fold protein [Flavobacterium sp. 3HN19-14]|uniref:P-loop NTPase fold protein n=1 Tax=Flavobacterium sp. 3HN19-14 TaxID=3448133 RepID=UPI003EE23115
MEPSYVKEIFSNYLVAKNTSYAILINGSWGSGKTYFWKSDLIKICTEKGYEPVYLSLNGISKIETLEYQFLVRLIPYLNRLDGKKASNVMKLGKNVISFLSNKFIGAKVEDILKDVELDLATLSKYVICFDDLERCKIPLPEILGFINNYVEHKNLKVVILSDESKIKENEAYNNIKEKVIGRILNFKNDLSKTLPLLFSQYEADNNDFYNFLKSRETFILDLLIEYKQDNLRIITFYIQALESLYPEINAFDKEFIDEVLLFALIISIEFKLGKLTSSDYINSRGYDDLNPAYVTFNFSTAFKNWDNENKVEPKEKSDIEKLYDTYLVNNINQYHFYNSVYIFILTGFLDKEMLTSELKLRTPPAIPEEDSSFRALMNFGFRDLSNEEFSDLTKKVLEFAKQGKYTIYEYAKISEFYYYFIASKLIDITIDQLNEILLTGISVAKQKDTDFRAYQTLTHFMTKREDQIIIDAIIEAHKEIENKKDSKKINKLFTHLNDNNIEAINEVFAEYSLKTELFEHLDPDSFFDTVLKVDNKTIKELYQLLDDRYNSTNIGEYLNGDYRFLNAVSKKLKSYLADSKDTSLQIFVLKELDASIDRVNQKLLPYVGK